MRRVSLGAKGTLILVVLILLISSQLPSSIARWVWRIPTNLVSVISTHLSSPLYGISATLRASTFEKKKLIDPADLQNSEQLLKRNWQLQQKILEKDALIGQLTGIKQTLQLIETRLEPAAVGWSLYNRQRPIISINKGQMHHIKPGQVVSHGIDLVGRITGTGSGSALVSLITEPGKHLDVHLVPGRAYMGTSSRYTPVQLVYQPRHRAFVAEDVDASLPVSIQVGDLAILADPRWPSGARGFVVGQVTEVEKLPTNPLLLRRVMIRPRMNIESIAQVIVMIPTTANASTASDRLQPRAVSGGR